MKSIEICIPTLNEEDVIENTLNELLAVTSESGSYRWSFVVADNGSTDRTAEKVRSFSRPDVQLLCLKERGKGRAVIAAARRSTADYFGYIDADLSAGPPNLFLLLEQLNAEVPIAIGSRLHTESHVNRSRWRSLVSEAFHRYAQLMVPVPVHDSQCGLKLMNEAGRRVLADCRETGWWFDREFLAKAQLAGLPVAEVPIEWEEFYYPDRKSKLSVLRDSMDSLVRMYQIRKDLRSYGKDSF